MKLTIQQIWSLYEDVIAGVDPDLLVSAMNRLSVIHVIQFRRLDSFLRGQTPTEIERSENASWTSCKNSIYRAVFNLKEAIRLEKAREEEGVELSLCEMNLSDKALRSLLSLGKEKIGQVSREEVELLRKIGVMDAKSAAIIECSLFT